MAIGKKSFIAYSEWKDVFDELSNEDAGKLIKHIFAYVNDENPQSEDVLIRAVFANIKNTLKRDLDKWETQLEQRRKAGLKSAEIRSTKSNDRSTTVEIRERNQTDSVNVNVNDNVSVNENTEEPPKGVPPKIFVPDFESYPITYRQGLKTWWDYKVEKKQKYKPTGWETFVKSAMEDFPTAVKFNEALKHSISNNYSGLYSKGSKAEVTPPNMAKMDKDPRFL